MSELAINDDAEPSADFWTLVQILRSARRLIVLTGAGCSRRSGIPDYRSVGAGAADCGMELARADVQQRIAAVNAPQRGARRSSISVISGVIPNRNGSS